ncbi:MAG: MarP family serine protease [Nakamurella sp.]
MNILDIVLILLVIAAAVSGYRQGLITAIFTLVTAIAGAIVAIQLAPLLMEHINDSTAKIAVGIACVVAGVGIGEVAGSTVGRAISRRINWRPAKAVDRALGLVGYALSVLVVIWLIAVPLASVPVPWLSSAIRGSEVLSRVDQAMPSQAQDVSAQLREVFNDSGFPAILDPLAPTPNTSVDPPDPSASRTPAVQAAGDSIVKVRAVAASCSRRTEGTGFVVGTGAGGTKVLTNAHVVAGSDRAAVEYNGRTLDGTVVLYDAQRDLAVLDVPDLTATPLTFAADPAEPGSDATVAGYPLDGPYTLTPARLRATIALRGPNIYSSQTVTREVYTIRAQVRPGNSGGPLLASDGTVLGVIFGAAIDETDVGFALTAQEVAPVVQAGLADDSAASTETCTAA